MLQRKHNDTKYNNIQRNNIQHKSIEHSNIQNENILHKNIKFLKRVKHFVSILTGSEGTLGKGKRGKL
jgi:hypothetical protein